MAIKVGMNGFGRIGRYMARLLADEKDLVLTQINARADNENLAHLLKYDSVFGKFAGTVEVTAGGMAINGNQVKVSRNAPGEWDWSGVDIVLETTGKFKDRKSCEQHLAGGAKAVLIGAPASDADKMIVMGVNDNEFQPGEHKIISNASCTTNCLAPVAKTVNDALGIKHGLMLTIHSYTMSQRILDGSHKDLRRGRAAAVSMIPTTTGAAKAVGKVIPSLKGKLDGMAVRVPTPNGSLVDLTVELEKPTSVEELNGILQKASENELKGIMGFSTEPLVSVDYVGTTYGGVVDGLCTQVMNGTQAKLIVWYDNEAGFTNQFLRLLKKVAATL